MCFSTHNDDKGRRHVEVVRAHVEASQDRRSPHKKLVVGLKLVVLDSSRLHRQVSRVLGNIVLVGHQPNDVLCIDSALTHLHGHFLAIGISWHREMYTENLMKVKTRCFNPE